MCLGALAGGVDADDYTPPDRDGIIFLSPSARSTIFDWPDLTRIFRLSFPNALLPHPHKPGVHRPPPLPTACLFFSHALARTPGRIHRSIPSRVAGIRRAPRFFATGCGPRRWRHGCLRSLFPIPCIECAVRDFRGVYITSSCPADPAEMSVSLLPLDCIYRH